ncbi:hypothetical protein [Hominifimenecus sp. rT4P-3]|uniref:hypothetical protein n=1 Tax=Hominifimenecus sp. rT4P-3 TaxID=3242979 RepID=UPI003DA6A5AC
MPTAGRKATLNDADGAIYPITLTACVVDANGKSAEERLAQVESDLNKQNKKLWEGTPISSGQILCNTTGYTVYDFYCTDGLMLRGVKILDTTNGKHYAVLGGSGGAYNGSAYVPAVWYGLIDIYDTHFYLHDVTMYTIQDGQLYSGHQISAVYGVW